MSGRFNFHAKGLQANLANNLFAFLLRTIVVPPSPPILVVAPERPDTVTSFRELR
jgi:hypothetical protein